MALVHTTRRTLLKTIAALGLAPPLLSVGPASGDEAVADTATLELAKKLVDAIRGLDDARTAKAAARSVYESLAPAVPDELIFRHPRHLFYRYELERDCEGQRIEGPSGAVRKIAYLPGLREDVDQFPVGSRVRVEMEAMIVVAERHEQACLRAREASGIDQAIEREWHAGDALRRVCIEVRNLKVRDLTGLAVKAKALEVYGDIPDHDRLHAAALFGPTLAQDVLAVFGRGEA